jgi:hypothetical protein
MTELDHIPRNADEDPATVRSGNMEVVVKNHCQCCKEIQNLLDPA